MNRQDTCLGRVAYLGFLGGLTLFVGLIAYQGIAEVITALAVAGWGLLGIALFHLLPMTADALGWRTLLSADVRLPARTFLWARWIGESVNGLLPVLQMGGNLVKARLLMTRGVPGAIAGASVVVDVTIVVFTQIVFTLLGLGLLLAYLGGGGIAGTALIGTAIMVALLIGFYRVQRRGLFGVLIHTLRRIVRSDHRDAFTDGAAALDAAVLKLYRKHRALAAASLWHLLSWLVGAGEVWLALYFLGHPLGLLEVLLLESLGQAVRAAAFTVPGALGIQEGGYLILGGLLGLSPDMALALSLTKRVRELALGGPGLIAWQLDSNRHLLRTLKTRVRSGLNHGS